MRRKGPWRRAACNVAVFSRENLYNRLARNCPDGFALLNPFDLARCLMHDRRRLLAARNEVDPSDVWTEQ